jgi:predicted nucleotidyltransferase
MEPRDERLARLLEDVVQTHHPLAVYLFGSRAEGRADVTSDYDLLVVLPDDVPEEALDVVKAFDSGLRTRVPADIIPTTKEVFVACRGNLSTLEGVAQARGRLLYGAL